MFAHAEMTFDRRPSTVRGDLMEGAAESQFCPEDNLVIKTLSGAITFPFIVKQAREVIGAPDWKWEYDVIVDLTNAVLHLTGSHIRNLSSLAQDEEITAGRVAIVTGRDVDYGLGRMYAILSGGSVHREVQVFRSAAEAREWLQSGS